MSNRQELFKTFITRLREPVIEDRVQILTLSHGDRKKMQLSHDRPLRKGDDQAPRDTVSPWGE